MAELTLYIVDDEKNIRSSLMEFINWHDLGITSVIAAKNGIDALEKMNTTPPDIILSDVRMPRMNGIALAEQVRSLYPDCIILFLSGYADKEYLMSAIRLEAYQYIEKPISMEDITAHVSNACKKKLESRKQKAHTESLEMFHSQGLMHTKNSLMQNLLQKGIMTKTVRDLLPNSFCYSLFCVYIPNNEKNKSFDVTLMFQAFEEVPLFGLYKEHFFFFLTSEKDTSKYESLLSNGTIAPFLSELDYSYTLCPHLRKETNFCILSEQLIDFSTYLLFYRKGYHTYTTNNTICHFEDYNSYLEQLSKIILSQNYNQLSELFSSWEAHFLHANYSIASIKQFYWKVFLLLQNNKLINDTLEKATPFYQLLENTDTYQELHTLIVSLLSKEHSTKQFSDTRICQITSYINEHIGNELLSVSHIAEYFHLSDNYLSSYFKNETGISLNQYITQIRIDKSKYLLLHTTEKIQTIAKSVGFSDTNYFSSVFKKNTHKTPLTYRKEGKHETEI